MFCGGSIRLPKGLVQPPKKQQRGDAADDDHVAVLGHEEHGELHGAVLGVITAGEFAFGLRQIEW